MFEGLQAGITAEMWPFASQIADRDQVLCALTLARQNRIAAANARVERAMIDGIGEVVASIDSELYHRLAALYGYETVNSDDFLRSLRRDNPDLFRIRNHTKAAHRIVVPCDWKEPEDAGCSAPPAILHPASCDLHPSAVTKEAA